jgi:hypothetical protein
MTKKIENDNLQKGKQFDHEESSRSGPEPGAVE